jgi:hypothetical protein
MAEASNTKAEIIVLGFFTEIEQRPKKADPMIDDRALIDPKGYLLESPNGQRVMEAKEVDWVKYSPAGYHTNTTEVRVEHIIPGKKQLQSTNAIQTAVMVHRWNIIKPAYEAWKTTNEIPTYGTPLSQWSGIKPAYVAELKKHGIATVEDVRDMHENHLERIRLPDLRRLKTEAGLFLESTDKSKQAAKEADMQRRLQELEERNAAMMALLEAQTAPVDEVAELRAELDRRGISYHHKAGAEKLRDLLGEREAA